MKKKLCTILTCACLLTGNIAYADALDMDASSNATLVTDTNVKVVNYVDGEEVALYTGPISQFENGSYIGTDFTGKNFIVVLEWGEELQVLYYIYPIKESTEENIERNSQHMNESDKISANMETNSISGLNSAESDFSFLEYNISYDIVSGEESYIDIDYSVYNSDDETKNVSLIATLYEGERLCDVKTEAVSISANGEQSDNFTLSLPENREDCYVKIMAWDDVGTLRPLGKPKYIKDLDEYSHEKYLYITANSDLEFKLFMNSAVAKGYNPDAIHTIKYNSANITPIDLCGFTYQKEMDEGYVSGTNMTINKVDLENSEIQYQFILPEGRNTGVNNYLKFKANTELYNEPIIYTIQ